MPNNIVDRDWEKESARLREEMDHRLNEQREEYERELMEKDETYRSIINSLTKDVEYRDAIIKSVLNIKI